MSLPLSIPVLSEKISAPDGGKVYVVQPALPLGGSGSRHGFVAENRREDYALDQLTRDLRRHLNDAAKSPRHDELARWSFDPGPQLSRLTLQFALRKQTIEGDFTFIVFEAFDRRIALCPRLDDLAFDIPRGSSLKERADAALRGHFRRLEKAMGRIDPEPFLTKGTVQLSSIELTIRTRQVFRPPNANPFAAIGGGGELSGSEELEKVGRCLNRLYPARLARAVLREDQVDYLTAHFAPGRHGPAPLLLVGPHQVGKTAIIHEFLHRRLAADEKPKPMVWLLSPQRLISGMIYVGQWQDRVHAILRHAVKEGLILYFDDLPGLFEAGRSANSDLTVGQVLKPYLEKGALRVLAEIAPEAWRRLREIDRGFADFFETVVIREPSDEETVRILIRTMQRLEGASPGLTLSPDTLSTVFDLQNRFARGRAFPGKAVDLLEQVARGGNDSAPEARYLGRDDVLTYFQGKTGIAPAFLHPGVKVERNDIRSFFSDRIMGQDDAVDAMTDLALRCISQVNEPGKPLGSLLFLGPTGVGKTECAKALGEYFFGSAERLARFDMNEFGGPDAVHRLIGTRHRPSGLLTGKVRRHPFSVVLLDEIEKAHPAVFDLLLQLLGDGRLTDASGETTDFGNCIVVMTSNLGARAARHQLGFGGGESDETAVYRSAAEKFFRPELFNRFDHIVAFLELSREEIEKLVTVMCDKALARAGLVERRLSLTLGRDVHRVLGELGFRPDYGARALRRAVEEFLVEPVALELARLPAGRPATAHCHVDKAGKLAFRIENLTSTPPNGWRLIPLRADSAGEFAEGVNSFLDRASGRLDELRGAAGPDGTIDPLDPGRALYFALREDLVTIRRMRDYLLSVAETERKAALQSRGTPPPSVRPHHLRYVPNWKGETFLEGLFAATSPASHFAEIRESEVILDKLSQTAFELLARIVTLEQSLATPESEAVVIVSGSPDESGDGRLLLAALHDWLGGSPRMSSHLSIRDSRTGRLDTSAQPSLPFLAPGAEAVLHASGPALSVFLAPFAGTHLSLGRDGSIAQSRLFVFPSIPGKSAEDQHVSAIEKARVAGLPPTRSCRSDSHVLDLAQGAILSTDRDRVWERIAPHLPAPPELAAFLESPPPD